MWYRAARNAAKGEVGLGGDDQVVPHILRHTCASRLVQGGIDIRRVQMWLGHQTLQMTMRTRIWPRMTSTAALPCWSRTQRGSARPTAATPKQPGGGTAAGVQPKPVGRHAAKPRPAAEGEGAARLKKAR
jgi:hypothetical protein